MKNETIKIEGMSCDHCVKAVEDELSELDLKVNNVEIGKAEIEYDEEKVTHKQIEDAIDEAGFKIIERVND